MLFLLCILGCVLTYTRQVISFVSAYKVIQINQLSRISPPLYAQVNNINRRPNRSKRERNEVEILLDNDNLSSLMYSVNSSMFSVPIGQNSSATVLFPELEQAGIDEKALRSSLIGKVLFKVLDSLFPVFREPNWYDMYDPPLTAEENLNLPYFDGYDFVNSSWTFHIRNRFGVWNWLDRMGFVPLTTNRVFLREDGKTVWSDGFYGSWYINPAINYIQIEKHYGRGYGNTQYERGLRVFQIQRWNFENEVGRYWSVFAVHRHINDACM